MTPSALGPKEKLSSSSMNVSREAVGPGPLLQSQKLASKLLKMILPLVPPESRKHWAIHADKKNKWPLEKRLQSLLRRDVLCDEMFSPIPCDMK